MEDIQAELDEAKKNLQIQRHLREVSESENEELKKQIERLSSEISELKKQLQKETRDAQTQTGGVDSSEKEEYPPHRQVSHGDSMVAPDLLENGVDSLAETLKQTAEAAISSTGYVMDESSGMYYDYNSGYYYDPNSCLFYDPRSGTYFYFNEESNTYEFHSKVDITQQSYPQGANDDPKLSWETKKKTKKKKKEKKKNTVEANKLGRFTENVPSSACEKCNRKKFKHKRHNHRNRKAVADVDERRKVSEREEVIDEDCIIISDEGEGDVVGAGDEKKRTSGRLESTQRNETEEETEDMETENNVLKDEKSVCDDDCRRDDSEIEMEDGEILDTSEDSDSNDETKQEDRDTSESGQSSSLSEEDDEMEDEEQPVNPLNYPPCVRLIVAVSESLPIGSLHIVTVTGGTIGREGSVHVLKIPEIGVSKQHAEFIYDQEKRSYTLRDLGSQNGTYINGTLIASGRTLSEAQLLSHKDVLQMGSTSFTVHIHPGTETCEDCEPGLVQAKVTAELSKTEVVSDTKADKETLRRKELKNIKKKYHLVGEEYKVHHDSTTSQGKYKDRAEQRRQTIGSDNPYQQDDAPASVNRSIDETNKGHQMLMKMGWKKGDSLGKGDTGLKEPIQVRVHSSKAGLGAMASMPMDYVQNTKKISINWKKAHERFQAHTPLYDGEESTDHLVLTKIKLERKKWVQGESEVLGELSRKGTDTSNPSLVDEPKSKESKEDIGVKPIKVDIFEDD